MTEKNHFAKAAKVGLFMVNPATFMINEALKGSIGKSKDLGNTGTIAELEEESIKQELSSRISESQAKVAQELAIASRIESADEVEIEEYYDISGEGNIGLSASESGINLGTGGSGRKVTKRIYRFKGWNEKISEEYSEEFMTENEED